MTNVRVLTANVAKENPHPAWAIETALQAADICLFQEVETPAARAALRGLGRDVGVFWPGDHGDASGTYTGGNAVPITWPDTVFKYHSAQVTRTTRGQAGITPNRYVVRLRLTHRPTGRVLVLMDTHMIDGAFTRHPGNAPEWRAHAKALENAIADELAAGRTWLIGGGDFNRSRWDIAGVTEVWANAPSHGSSFYDGLFYVGGIASAGTLLALPGSDHKAVLATFTDPEETPMPNPPRQARSLDTLLAQVNAYAPQRSKASDGGLGDPAHAARKSDHNPNPNGVWRARDFTHDPEGGFDAGRFAESVRLLGLGGHPALGPGSYVIFNRRIASATLDGAPWDWEPYLGTNAHEHHAHVSVATLAAGYDSTTQWALGLFNPKDTPMTPAQEAKLDKALALLEHIKAQNTTIYSGQGARANAILKALDALKALVGPR